MSSATLYHYPMSCSLASVIAGQEFVVPFRIEHVDVYSKELLSGGSLFDIHPLGQVATLRFGDGTLLTQNVAILQWIQKVSGIAVACEHQLISWLTFCATELHRGLLWVALRSDISDEQKHAARLSIHPILRHVDRELAGRQFLVGDSLSVADCYLFWALLLAPRAGVELAAFTDLIAYQNRLSERPAFHMALIQDQSDFADIKIRYPDTLFHLNPTL